MTDVGVFGIPILMIEDGEAGSRSAVDLETGKVFTEFEREFQPGGSIGYCVVCDTALESGWMCLDGGEEYCEEHVIIGGSEDGEDQT